MESVNWLCMLAFYVLGNSAELVTVKISSISFFCSSQKVLEYSRNGTGKADSNITTRFNAFMFLLLKTLKCNCIKDSPWAPST